MSNGPTISWGEPHHGSALAARLHSVLDAAAKASTQLVTVTVPAPLRAAETVFICDQASPAHYFASGESQADVGLDAVVSLESDDFGNLSELEQRAEELLRSCFEVGLDAAARSPRFYGGFAFDPTRSADPAWQAFPRIGFHLPRYRYSRDGESATLCCCALTSDIADPAKRQQWVTRTVNLLDKLEQLTLPGPSRLGVVSREESPTRERWTMLVELAQRQIAAAPLEKVVLAREVRLTLNREPDVARLLLRLAQLAPETTRFALRAKQSVFLGATPERLVHRFGSEIRTEALAGSVRATDPLAEELLLSSDKERHEHQLVVDEIERRLRRLGAIPQYPAKPQVRQLRHVLHLFTPFVVRTAGAPHVLSLASQLHPTPAIGGVPESEARRFIRDNEGFDRGLYAGAVGWFDADGDGDLLVALRSGLLTGCDLRLYAGAGIVADSIPSQELDETDLKCESLLEALELGSLEATGGK